MKYYHYGISLVILILLSGCKIDTDETTRAVEESLNNEKATTAWQYLDRSITLARANGCWACHRVERGILGPGWRAVSKHYKNDPNGRDWLLYKVKNGGAGVWTETTSGAVMPAYSPRVSDEHISQLVDFILSLEKDK
ncbi:hypothetical protein MNBD_GAMMA16-330 [hydrothermal vent metagenome]|uniref:Cytochrome c domain-containing protein n=1 Tax=hydrothermal vent metagenome TaxID=652676 RepID=A0A3B0ZAU4_9ZZZZ